MQFKVPHDVLRPDRIVAFLTLRQLVILLIGGGITYSLFIILQRQYAVEVWLPPVAFLTLTTLAFAFFRFRELPFEKFIFVFIEYKFRPQARTWQKMQGDFVLSVLSDPLKKTGVSKVQVQAVSERERREKLEAMSKIVDSKSSSAS